MPVKLFQAYGRTAIVKLEGRVNDWLARQESVRVKDIRLSSIESADEESGGERRPCVVMCILYEEA